jgi:hypothetical protein
MTAGTCTAPEAAATAKRRSSEPSGCKAIRSVNPAQQKKPDANRAHELMDFRNLSEFGNYPVVTPAYY